MDTRFVSTLIFLGFPRSTRSTAQVIELVAWTDAPVLPPRVSGSNVWYMGPKGLAFYLGEFRVERIRCEFADSKILPLQKGGPVQTYRTPLRAYITP